MLTKPFYHRNGNIHDADNRLVCNLSSSRIVRRQRDQLLAALNAGEFPEKIDPETPVVCVPLGMAKLPRGKSC